MKQCTSTETWTLLGGRAHGPIQCAYVEGHSGEHLFSVLDESDAIRWKLAADRRDELQVQVDQLRALLALAVEQRDAAVKERDEWNRAGACPDCDRNIAERIAKWLDHQVHDPLIRNGLNFERSDWGETFAAEIRAGAWRKEQG